MECVLYDRLWGRILYNTRPAYFTTLANEQIASRYFVLCPFGRRRPH